MSHQGQAWQAASCRDGVGRDPELHALAALQGHATHRKGQPRVSPSSHPEGTPSCRPQTTRHSPGGGMGCWLPAACFISLPPSPQHLPPSSPLGHFATHPHCQTSPFLYTPFPGRNTGPYQFFLLITAVKAAHGAATQVNGGTKQGGAEHLMFCLRLPRALSCTG